MSLPAKSHFLAAHTAYVQSNGTLAVSGSNSNGQLGRGNTTQQNAAVAATTFPSGKRAMMVATGPAQTAVILTDGTLYSCGLNSNGELGLGVTSQYTSLTQVTVPAVPTDVAFGSAHMAVVTLDGSVYTTGLGTSGRLGLGNTLSVNTLQSVNLGGNPAYSVACGDNYTLVLTRDGNVYAFGANDYGQLGDGTTTARLSPVFVLGNVQAIHCGQYTSFAIMKDNTLRAWGNNGVGKSYTGTGSTDATVLTPTAVTLPVGKTLKTMSAGKEAAIAIFTDSTMYGWGKNVDNTLGNLTLNANYTTPTLMDPFGGSSKTLNNVVIAGYMTHVFYTETTPKIGYMGLYTNGAAGNNTASSSSSTVVNVAQWDSLGGGVVAKSARIQVVAPTASPAPFVEPNTVTYYVWYEGASNVSTVTFVLNGTTTSTVQNGIPETTFSGLTDGVDQVCYMYATGTDTHSIPEYYRTIQTGTTADAPTITDMTQNGSTLSLSWDPPLNNGGSRIKWYIVYDTIHEQSSIVFPFEGYKASSVTPEFPTGTYDLYMKAINDAGHGTPVSIGSFTFPA